MNSVEKVNIGNKKRGGGINQTTRCKVSGDSLYLLGALLIYQLSPTLQPPSPLPPLSMLLARQKIAENFKTVSIERGEGGGSGKGWNCRFGRYW